MDGGYVNNLPADVMIKMGVHTVINDSKHTMEMVQSTSENG